MSTLNKSLAALALAGMALSAHAHKPWLLPTSTIVEGKEAWVTIDAAISEGLFDVDHQPLKIDTVVITGPDGAKLEKQNVANGKMRNSFDLKLPKPGTYKIELVSKNVFGSYKNAAGEMKRFRGTEETLAKDVPADATEVKLTRTDSRLETFVSTGDPDMAVFKTTGVGLEMVPVTHPNDLRAGAGIVGPARIARHAHGKCQHVKKGRRQGLPAARLGAVETAQVGIGFPVAHLGHDAIELLLQAVV